MPFSEVDEEALPSESTEETNCHQHLTSRLELLLRWRSERPARHRRLDSPWPESVGSGGDVSVELPERIRPGPSCGLMRRMPSTMSGPRLSNGPHSRLSGRWVATYFVAALRRSPIGLLGAFASESIEHAGAARANWRGCPVSTPTSRLPSCLLRSAFLPASYSPGSSWLSRAVEALIACRFRALWGGAP